MPIALEIAFGRRSQTETQAARAAHALRKERIIHQGRHLELVRTPKKASKFLRAWHWIKAFVKRRPPMTVQPSSISRPEAFIKESAEAAAGVLSPEAEHVLNNFISYEREIRKIEVQGPSGAEFVQLGLSSKELASYLLQFDADLKRFLSDRFQEYYSKNPLGNIPGMVWQAYKAVMSSFPEILENYPSGYLDTMKNAVSGGLAHTLMHNIGPSNDWSAPVAPTMQGSLPSVAVEGDYLKIRTAVETIFPRLIEESDKSVRKVTRDNVHPNEALEAFLLTYLDSFKERYIDISGYGKNPVAPASLWNEHAKAQSQARKVGVRVAFGKGNLYQTDRDAFLRVLYVLCGKINQALQDHQELGSLGDTMPSELLGPPVTEPHR